ncbi:MAG TPA: MBL fold metallo-hydrolase [Phycisphaerae bacterium]|nr:MBL fold metallo-hydrolase [Phycisphaerae bacterium]
MSAEPTRIRVICLGSGTSHGIPMIGCECPVCTSDDPRDKRTRPGIAVSWADCTVLIDTPTELRLQCVANDIQRADAILFTHHHADHIAGLDDVRRFNWLGRSPLNCYGMQATLDRVRQMFLYAFEDDADYPSHKPDLQLVPIDDGPFELFGLTVTPIPLMHGPMPVLGYRFGRFAYCTDCNFISEESLELLTDLEVLILDAVRLRPHPTHFHLDQAVEMAHRIAARQTYFTHIAHQIGHAAVSAGLPPDIELAHDGLTFDVASA